MNKTTQKRTGRGGPIVNTRLTHRNDACPCGRRKVISYPGTDFPDREVPMKFKHCCMNEQGEQAGTAKSTAELLKERRRAVGFPMRDYLNTPISQRRDVYQRGGFAPRATSSNNNRKRSSGRLVYHDRSDILLGTSIMIAVGSPKGCVKHGTVAYETIRIGRSTQVANRLAFIPFEYDKKGGSIAAQIEAHRKRCDDKLGSMFEKYGYSLHQLEKWTNKTRRVNLSE